MPRQAREQLRAVQQQRRLLRQRFALLQRRFERLGKLEGTVIARFAQLVRLVEEHDRAAHPVHHRAGFRIQQRHERLHVRETAALQQLLRIALCARGELFLRRARPRGVEQLLSRAALVHILKQLVERSFRLCGRAFERLLKRMQKPRRSLARLALVHKRQFHRRAERRLLQIFQRPLRRSIEAADGVDLVVEPFHAHGRGQVRREHIENSAAHGEFSAPLHLVHTRIARARQVRAHGFDIGPRAHSQLGGQREHALRRHQPVLQRFNRRHHRACPALSDGEKHLHAAVEHIAACRRNIKKRRLSRGQQVNAVAHELQKIVVAARSLRFRRYDKKRRPAGFPGQRRRQKRFL